MVKLDLYSTLQMTLWIIWIFMWIQIRKRNSSFRSFRNLDKWTKSLTITPRYTIYCYWHVWKRTNKCNVDEISKTLSNLHCTGQITSVELDYLLKVRRLNIIIRRFYNTIQYNFEDMSQLEKPPTHLH